MRLTWALSPLAVLAIGFGSHGAAAPSAPDGGRPAQHQPTVCDRAEIALSSAAAKAKNAACWAMEGVASMRLGERATGIAAAARAEYDGAFARARATLDRTLGLRLLGPADPAKAGAVRWFAPAPGEQLSERIVLLVHGLDEPGDVWVDLAPLLRDAGFSVARFDYPNDQSPRDSADLLAEAMTRLRAAGVRRVDIVAHSMGGLVCRDLLTRPALYGGDATARGTPAYPAVDRLVMMGTPNHGSVLAHLRFLAELRDQFARWTEADHLDPAALLGFFYDGRGEAGDDLLPCSDYLCELNSRPLPTGVRMTSIVGAYSELTRPEIESLFTCPAVRRVIGADRADAWRADAESIIGAIGDGVVPVRSTELRGVEDVVTVTANHRTMIRSIGLVDSIERLAGCEPGPPPAIPVVLDRLSR